MKWFEVWYSEVTSLEYLSLEPLRTLFYGPTRVLCGKVFLHVTIFMHFVRGS